MMTWAVVYAFKVLQGGNGLWLVIAMGCDCYVAFCIASALIGKWP